MNFKNRSINWLRNKNIDSSGVNIFHIYIGLVKIKNVNWIWLILSCTNIDDGKLAMIYEELTSCKLGTPPTRFNRREIKLWCKKEEEKWGN